MTNEDKFLAGVEGFYPNIPFDVYCKLRAVNASTLKNMGVSPKHFKHAYDVKSKDSDAFKLGRHVHSAVFERENFEKEYTVAPEFTGKTKDGKDSSRSAEAIELKKKWYDENKDKTIITIDEKEEAETIRDAVYNHTEAKRLLELTSYNELTFVWKDEKTGLLCKGRLDRFLNLKMNGESVPAILDLKTIGKVATERNISRAVEDNKYYFSMQFYCRGLQTLLRQLGKLPNDKRVQTCVLIFVETIPTHDVVCRPLGVGWLVGAEHIINDYMNKAKIGFDTGVWVGISNELETLEPPKYLFSEE